MRLSEKLALEKNGLTSGERTRREGIVVNLIIVVIFYKKNHFRPWSKRIWIPKKCLFSLNYKQTNYPLPYFNFFKGGVGRSFFLLNKALWEKSSAVFCIGITRPCYYNTCVHLFTLHSITRTKKAIPSKQLKVTK